MSRFNTIKTVASTLTIAVTLGFLVQYGETTPRVGDGKGEDAYNKAPRTLMLSTNAQGQPVFGMPDIVTTPLNHAANVQRVVAVDAVYGEMATPAFEMIMAAPIAGCEATLSAAREPAAMVALSLSAPCAENQAFAVSHSGMRVASNTDSDGNATVRIPALMTDAEFKVTFNNVLQASTKIFVPELRQYDRAVLQWETADNMRLHALENGAQIGDPGHVWSASLHSPQDTREGKNGFVVYVGDADAEIPYQAEVYTFPEGQMNRDGGVDLRVGVTVSPQNCGREIDATTIQTNAGQTLVSTQIVALIPPCSYIGEVVFFGDKFSDLTIASN
ncbi:hypothetical protein BC777_2157 [Yoonia maricola]|uniref:Uncharacterized protein n=1 Tax=Yoonia maricola TaxID=420999 RepID=A0A2M8W4G5_9RHOB|nr:hypothetical protein [Yoonia maricola]PJI85810.1 hypothetical protein BC777_2157 [Yoonia maricola]